MTEPTRVARALVRCPFCQKFNRVDLTRAKDRPACGECGKPIVLDRPIKLTDDDFDRIIGESDVPVLVDFHADWCGPCKVIAPALDEIARDRMGQLLVGKLDTDRNPATATKYRVTALPTIAVFRSGKEAVRQTGAVPKRTIEEVIARAMA
jgi:thioredoxin 2